MDRVKRNEFKNPEMVDMGFLLRELAAKLDEIRKECSARQELIGQIIALSVARMLAQDSDADATVRGELAIGMPDIKTCPALPKRGSPNYRAFAEWLGIPKEVIDKTLIEFHFPSVTEFLTSHINDSLPDPPGIVDTFQRGVTVYRKHNSK